MLNFTFSYKGFTITLVSSVDSIPYVIKCRSDDDSTFIIQDCYTRSSAFNMIHKLLAFFDSLE